MGLVGSVYPRPDTGLDFVWQRLSGPRWVRSRARSCCRHRILCFSAPEAWNPSFCTCPRPETTNIQPDLQNGGQTLHAFVSQTPGGPSGAIIQSEWGLDLSSPPPLCSLSLGPLSRRKRLERGSFACFASGSGWATRSGKGRRGEGARTPGWRAEGASAELSAFLPQGQSALPGKTWAWTRVGQFAYTGWMKIPCFGSRGPYPLQPFPRVLCTVSFSSRILVLSYEAGRRLHARGGLGLGGWGSDGGVEKLAFFRHRRVFQRTIGRRRSEACAILKVIFGGESGEEWCYLPPRRCGHGRDTLLPGPGPGGKLRRARCCRGLWLVSVISCAVEFLGSK